MKKLIIALLATPVFLSVLIYLWWLSAIAPVKTDTTSQSFLITKGSSAGTIGSNLEKAGIIRSSLAFKLYLQLSGKAGKIPTGEFRLSGGKALSQVVDDLLKGPLEVWVTIPEGLRREETAAKLANGLGRTGASYQNFVSEFLSLSKNNEGYLFPDTYLLPKDTTPALVYSKMISTFTKMASFSPDKDTVILASLLERETRGDAEKPVVAGIILKRLNAGWPLQIDATVQYAVGNWKPLLKTDLEIKSPYNTYLYKGLPPAPICSPGLASLKAAVNPQTSDFWFYIHDSEGAIHYAATAEAHAANVRKYLGK